MSEDQTKQQKELNDLHNAPDPLVDDDWEELPEIELAQHVQDYHPAELINEINKWRIDVQVLTDGGIPFKKNKTDAGFDLIATSDVTLVKGEICKHPLNFKMVLPKGTYGEITTKSGLGSKGMLVYAGIIDEEYRGVPHVVCTNLDVTPLTIKKGQKIAQMIIHNHSPNYFMNEVEEVSEETDRGKGGFGSTGL